MKSRPLRSLALPLVVFAIVCLAIEAIAWVGVFMVTAKPFTWNRIDVEKRRIVAATSALNAETARATVMVVPHPYMGYVYNPDHDSESMARIHGVPMIVHVPAALHDRYSWDLNRPAYTTDLTPTLYRLLGHEPVPPQPYFGESLAATPGVARPPARDRMVAASYGSVYGALMDGATRLLVVDAIQRREMAFTLADGAAPDTSLAVTPGLRRDGEVVIRSTVEALARQYQFSPPPR